MNIPPIKEPIAVCWLRRDLRLYDNPALHQALESGLPVVILFIFDRNILTRLKKSDRRISFIHQQLQHINDQLQPFDASVLALRGAPTDIWAELCGKWSIRAVYYNRDYEPYGKKRDEAVARILRSRGIDLIAHRDHVIFEPDEILKKDGTPYTVYTAYKRRWLERFDKNAIVTLHDSNLSRLYKKRFTLSPIKALGFKEALFSVPPATLPIDIIAHYDQTRDFPALHGVTRLGVHFRFGTISIREAVLAAFDLNSVWLSELIWREFFIMILHHFPHTIDRPFREKYTDLPWSEHSVKFERWKSGKTGFPIVDAGMRELMQTGYMHNRVRMITANFLTKLLRIDWRLGERWFADQLLDFELASNVGNWQWAAGCGCDAAPYFRIFNPQTQQQKFDADFAYIRKWLPEFGTKAYPSLILDYKSERSAALAWFKAHLQNEH